MKQRQRKKLVSPTPPYTGPLPEEMMQMSLRAAKAREMMGPDRIVWKTIEQLTEMFRKANEHFAARQP